jgi:hypothetical protein
MSTFTAGQILRALDLNVERVNVLQAIASGGATITTTQTDVTGATITFTTTQTNTVVAVYGHMDAESNGSTDGAVLYCVVDGVTQTGTPIQRLTGRAQMAHTWRVSLAATGSHTIKLQVNKFNNSNTVQYFQDHTRIVIIGPGIS